MSARNSTFSAKITGVKELNLAFRAVDTELPKELRVEFLVIAQKVATRVRAAMPWVTGEAASSVTAGATQRTAYVQEGINGGPKKDYVPWLDFGGEVGRNKSVSRPFIAGGRYLYPIAASEEDASGQAAIDAVERVAKRAGLDVAEGV